MTSSYTVTEPHPTVVKNSYTHSGRGGAGNFFRAPTTTAPSGVPTTYAAPVPKSSASRFYSGRGGAGNAHATSERPVLSFDEDYATRSGVAMTGHVGRGGAGNVYGSCGSTSVALSTRVEEPKSAQRRDSSSTEGSLRYAGLWGRISSASLGRH